jgi:hypothetical protein
MSYDRALDAFDKKSNRIAFAMRLWRESADMDAEIACSVDDHVVLDKVLNGLALVAKRYKGEASVGGEIDPGKRVKSRGRPQEAGVRDVGFPDDHLHLHSQAP